MTTREEEMERALHMATLYGANEFATKATTLGEKVFWRLVREDSLRKFRALGGVLAMTNEHESVLTLSTTPAVTFDTRDIELMRAAVAAHDAKPK